MLLCNGLNGISIGLLIPAITSKAMQAEGSSFALQSSGWLVLAEALGPMLGLASQSSLMLFVTSFSWRAAQAFFAGPTEYLLLLCSNSIGDSLCLQRNC